MTDAGTFDVAIVGAGMAGSALALALRDSGLRIALIEARPLTLPPLPTTLELDSFDNRVSALNLKSSTLLEELGAWPAIAAYRACAYRHMTVWDAQGSGEIEFDAAEVDAPALGHIVENRAVIHALLERVQQLPEVALLAPRRLQSLRRDAAGVVLEFDQGAPLCARLLVAADGALSAVRELLAFATREWDYGHRALVTTVATDKSHGDTAWQRFLPSGPLAFLPLPSGSRRFCSIVWSLQDALAEDVLALDDEAFCARLGEAFEHRLGTVLAAAPRTAFPLRQRHAVDYVQPGVALVGDAAHTIHPLAGQGINLGLQDVAVLAEEIRAAHARGVSPGELAVLRRYQRRRKGENLLMMGAMDGFKFLFEQESLPLRWLRNAGMSGVSRALPLKQQIMRRAMGMGA